MSARSLRQDFLRALGASAGVYLFGTAMAFLVGVQLARGLGVAGYGFYGSAFAAANLGATFAAGGLQLHATRDLAASQARGDRAGAGRLVGWLLRHVFALSAAGALMAGCYVWWGLGGAPELVGATMLATLTLAVLILTGAIVRGAGRLVLGQALDTAIRPAVLSVLLLGAVMAAGPLEPAMAMALTISAMLVALPFGWGTLVQVWRVPDRGTPSPGERRAWRKASATMGLTTLLTAADASLPLILVGALAGIAEAGLFRVASAIMVFSNLPITMVAVMGAAIAASLFEQQDTAQLRRLAAASAAAMVIPTAAIAGGLWIFGEFLLGIAFGADYRAAWPIMAVLAGASVVASMAGISINLLHAARHDAVVTRGFVLSLAVTCAGLAVAAFDGRAVAFAAAVLAAMAARTVFLIAATRRLVGIDPGIWSVFVLIGQPSPQKRARDSVPGGE